jgi:6-phosphogluconolactonase/glucosamine-6-phosphate isomerase/deaminase
LSGPRRSESKPFLARDVVFLDEYFGPYPAYYQWAYRNLRRPAAGEARFAADRIFTPRGCFFENGRVVTSSRLEEILADWPEDWEARTLPGEAGAPPEVRIRRGAEHPVLGEIRQSLDDYDALVRDHNDRLQLLGIGVGGAIAHDRGAGGHIGFVEYGAADGDSGAMLVRLAPSTIEANRDDFLLRNADGDARLEPSSFAVSQGISTILSASRMLLMAWGAAKQEAVARMFLGEPGPKNPAAWIQEHAAATVFLDRAAFGNLDREALEERGWAVQLALVSIGQV